MKFALVIVLALPLLLTGCKKKLTSFNMDYTSNVVIMSSVGQILPFDVMTPAIESNSESEFSSNDTKKEHIKSLKLKELKLTITSPSGKTFSFLNSLEIFISSPDINERKVAFKENIPSSVGGVLQCEIVDLDLQEYIKQETFRIRIKAVTDETISEDVYVDVYTKFQVEAQLIK